MSDLTVVYYTSNRETELFENNIKQSLLDAIGDLPLISVSQKPIDFGKNICVGDVGVSSQNAFRQLQIGAMEAKTVFVAPVESDFLYSKEYFEVRPHRANVAYIMQPLWVCFHQRGYAKVFCEKPRGSESAIVVGREYLIGKLEFILKDVGKWGPLHADKFPYLLHVMKRRRHRISTPIITFKTDRNMHRKTPHSAKTKTRELAPWGSARDLITKYFS
jgi:hypothetical protein